MSAFFDHLRKRQNAQWDAYRVACDSRDPQAIADELKALYKLDQDIGEAIRYGLM